ncbi:MAG: hypothetical protein IH944_00055 [Armatimonadetes bacterium]|nr:hypothetical protein [Armatimonadota bacterium]
MPTYVYECKKCETVFEAEQRMSDDPLSDCESCGAKKSLRRLIQPTAILFKGSGFYHTDNAPAKKEASESSADPPASGGDDGACNPPAKEDE